MILTLNEASNIQRCIRSVAWSDDIVVLDSCSSDETCELARIEGARVYQREFDNFASQRNYALEHIELKHSWVLHLDADEVVTPLLRDEIEASIERDHILAYRIASKLMFMGKWLRFSGMYPSYQVRLGHKEYLKFRQVGHGQREDLAEESIGTLKSAYLHYGFSKGVTDWIERHNRYSTDEARLILAERLSGKLDWPGLFSRNRPTRRRRAMKQLAARLPFRSILRFLYMYVLRLGFLDGVAGYRYCRLMAQYEYWTQLKLRESLSA